MIDYFPHCKIGPPLYTLPDWQCLGSKIDRKEQDVSQYLKSVKYSGPHFEFPEETSKLSEESIFLFSHLDFVPQVGDLITARCVSPPSVPPVVLTWCVVNIISTITVIIIIISSSYCYNDITFCR